MEKEGTGQAYRRRRHEQGGTKGNILIYIKVEAGKTRKERDADGWLEARGTGGLRKGRDGNGRPGRHAKAETCAYRTKSHKPGREREQHIYIPYVIINKEPCTLETEFDMTLLHIQL
ncbi:hypothetical protein [Paraprevotella xylaniphila]|uniref:hypothetical protein n=1 Tax=Paraprevotella xylaniphila TaxID=454155 RepID=UPI0026DCEF65|nr:hypothetical protein [Paraprevotella xylaniphila]